MATVDVTTQKVQRILATSFSGVTLAEDGFNLTHGSTMVHVSVADFGKDPDGNPSSVVRIAALVARDVKPTNEFYKWAATDGQQVLFGSVTVLPQDDGNCLVLFDHSLLGDYLDPAELASAVVMVALTADDFDDIVHSRFGGKRFTDE